MITEDYVSFETAKLLKENGFDEECCPWYGSDGNIHKTGCEMRNSDCALDSMMAPTLQMAMKWLREVHNRHISIEHSYVLNKYRICITKYNPNNISNLNNMLYVSAGYDFSVYEEACEVAIKYCLENLI